MDPAELDEDDRPVRLLLSGGGTAGHVYPALAMLAAWENAPGALPEVCWVGSRKGMERLIVSERGIPFRSVAAGALRGKSARATAANIAKLVLGFFQALVAVRSFRPDVVMTTGGYVSAPVALAARLLRIPVLVFLPDVKPGLAVRAQAPLARRVAASFQDAVKHLPARKTVVTGYPVRPALLLADRDGARERLGLRTDLPVLLLYGGSLGARALNHGVLAALPQILERCEFVHVCGELDHADLLERTAGLPESLAERYHLHAFLGDGLVDAMAAADLCVARAGASTLAELPAVGLPAVVVPGQFSDQQANADYLAAHGAAVVVDNDAVVGGALPGVVLELLANDEERQRMAEASRSLARPDASMTLINEIRALVGR